MKEVKMLMLRKLIADLEFINASAVRDFHRYDEWQCDYHKWRLETIKLLDEIVTDIEVAK